MHNLLQRSFSCVIIAIVRIRMKIKSEVTMRKNIQPILDYVEGRLSADKFYELFKSDKNLQKALKIRLNRCYSFLSDYHCNLFDYLANEYEFKNKPWDCISMRAGLQDVLSAYLDNFNIQYEKYSDYSEEYRFLLKIQPDWLDVLDDSILQPIIDSIPTDLSKTKRIAIGKEKVRAMFRYDKTYPRWVQSPEWPIVDGQPLVFSHQEKVKGADMFTKYYFYDPDTKEETVIEQFS